VRRFNAAFQQRHGAAPSSLRKARADRPASGIALTLDCRPPFDHAALLAFLAARAIPGVSEVSGGVHRRSVRMEGRTGIVSVSPDPERARLHVHVSDGLERDLTAIVRGVRAAFDLDAHPAPIAAALEGDPWLGALVRRRPGLRVPGAFDAFETSVLAILGQQVSVRAACTLAGRLAARFGAPLERPAGSIRTAFPDAAAIARARPSELARVGIVRARAEALSALARAIDSGALLLERGGDAEVARRKLLELPGIGPWTAEYVCLRVLGWPDAFPASDLGLRRALGVDARELGRRAESWRPWRGYAALHLWQSLKGDDA
jgi:AraC family transcriptional regulator of adaptative response / DNA-3-methyladenine glycosylase II